MSWTIQCLGVIRAWTIQCLGMIRAWTIECLGVIRAWIIEQKGLGVTRALIEAEVSRQTESN